MLNLLCHRFLSCCFIRKDCAVTRSKDACMTGGFLYLEASLSGVMITGVTNDFFDSWVTGGVVFPQLFSVHFPLSTYPLPDTILFLHLDVLVMMETW